jgi:hypothetical protein
LNSQTTDTHSSAHNVLWLTLGVPKLYRILTIGVKPKVKSFGIVSIEVAAPAVQTGEATRN